MKTKQHLLFGGFLGILLLVVFMFLKLVLHQQSLTRETASYKAQISTGSSRIDPKEVWMEKVTTEMDLNTKRLESLEKMLHNLLKLNTPNNPSGEERFFHQSTGFDKGTPEGLRQEIQEVGQQNLRDNLNNPVVSVLSSSSSSLQSPIKGQMVQEQKPVFRSKGIQKTSLQLSNAKSHKPLKTTDNTIPAGAFAQAVLMGGVDASTSIQASSDPRPVLLRITNAGTLPRKFKSDLDGCHALAACYGDISSERVFMRLEKITCTERKTGEVIEISAQGYVAGEDGRAGLRGTVVDRAGRV
jgi:conjugal transfer pilus assembly protein TraB